MGTRTTVNRRSLLAHLTTAMILSVAVSIGFAPQAQGQELAADLNGRLVNTSVESSDAIPLDTHASGKSMYRLYNPNSGEHFYTANPSERDNIIRAGWHYEGVGWVAPSSGTEVYRLYNSHAGEHHYTTSANERNTLVSAGWKYEGVGWYSDRGKAVRVYREYNPNQYTCNHNYTTSKSEHNELVRLGWRNEGTGWFGVSQKAEVVPFSNPKSITMPQKVTQNLPMTLSGTLRYDGNYQPIATICGAYYLVFDSPIKMSTPSSYYRKQNPLTLNRIQVGLVYNDNAAGTTKKPRRNAKLDPFIGKHVVITGELMNDAGTAYYSTPLTLTGIKHVALL